MPWINRFLTWQADFKKRVDAGQAVPVELLVGAGLVEEVIGRASTSEAEFLKLRAEQLRNPAGSSREVLNPALDPQLTQIMFRLADRKLSTVYQPELTITVDRELARFGAWYEVFPRSLAPETDRTGTFSDCERLLPRLAKMGFDVLYLPPIHPIGKSFRKGKNNAVACQPGEPGSPWAIGSAEGGHKAVNPELGPLEDFQRLVARARELKIEIALDIAFQCAPDHPYVTEHPEWFRHRPDGSIQYAENPPKIYQDIVPFNFECDSWKELWE